MFYKINTSKLFAKLTILLFAVLYNVCASKYYARHLWKIFIIIFKYFFKRKVDTSIYTLTSSGHKQIDSYKVGDSIEIICHHEMNISLVRPEHNDKFVAVNYYKDKVLFFRNNGDGTGMFFKINMFYNRYISYKL